MTDKDSTPVEMRNSLAENDELETVREELEKLVKLGVLYKNEEGKYWFTEWGETATSEEIHMKSLEMGIVLR
jgi:hypothetical protein